MRDPSQPSVPRDEETSSSSANQATGEVCQHLFENAFDTTVILDAEGQVKYISPSIRHVLGYRPEERIGQHGFDLLHEDDVAEVQRRMAELRSRDRARTYLQVRLRHKDGSWRTVEIIGQNLLSHPTIQGMVVNYRDITERLEKQEALRLSEEKYHKAFEAVPEAIMIMYIQSGRILDANEGFEVMSGMSRNDVIGKTVADIGVWPDAKQRVALVDLLKQDKHVRNLECELVDTAGDVHYCLMSAEQLELGGESCMLTVTRDITVQKLAAEELQRASEQLRSDHEALAEKNAALKQVLDHMEQEKAAYRHELNARVENLLAPVIRKLKRSDSPLKPKEIAQLEDTLRRIVEADLDQTENAMSKLTPRELDICNLIKRGLSSKEIADELGLSPQTVHKHRQVIRRKLKLHNKDLNLATFLRSR